MPTGWSISANAHYCTLGKEIIILDLNSDSYFLLTEKQSAWLREVTTSGDRPSAEVAAFAKRMCENGLLVRQPIGCSLRFLKGQDLPTASLLDKSCTTDLRLNVGHLVRFLLALTEVSLVQRFFDQTKIVLRARAWKSRQISSSLNTSSSVEGLTSIFHRVSPFFFSSSEACYFRSLTLLRFLSLYGINAEWVFAVRIAPFRAHCWVEHEQVILNEHLERALEFKPIMVV